MLSPGYLSRLRFWMTTPAAIIGLVTIVGAARMLCMLALDIRKGRRRAAKNPLSCSTLIWQLLPILLRFAFLCYPFVTKVAFEAFLCVTFDDGSSWLVADVAIACDSAKHDSIKQLAWLAVFCYAIGLWVVNAGLLLCVRRSITIGRVTLLSRATAFLHGEFKPQFYFWELMEVRARPYCLHCLFALPDTALPDILLRRWGGASCSSAFSSLSRTHEGP